MPTGVRMNARLTFDARMIEKIIAMVIDRMSVEDKARLLDIAVDRFFAGMTADEKQQWVEKLISRLLDEVDVKVVLPQIMALMWKEAGDSALMGKMSKMATHTSGKISEVFAEFVKGARREE